jgi:malonyl-CoA O-methyltransferase
VGANEATNPATQRAVMPTRPENRKPKTENRCHNPPPMPLYDRHQIRRAFSRAAPAYNAVAVLQHEVEARLLEQLDYVQTPPARIVDIGCGPGRASAALRKRWPKAHTIGLDLALPMLREARGSWWRPLPRICADAQALPLADQSVDLLFSNLCLQWVEDLPATLAGFRRVLRPGGLLLFSTFADDTLFELREAFAAADGAAAHVSPFLPMQRIGDAVLAAGFRDPVLDADRFTLTYADPRELMRELQAIGAANALADRRRSLTGKTRMQRALAAYEPFRANGRVPASYEVCYAHAWGPEPGQPRHEGNAAIATFPVERMRIRRRGE